MQNVLKRKNICVICSFGPVVCFKTILDLLICISKNYKEIKSNYFFYKSVKKGFVGGMHRTLRTGR